jgi:hypothetical protein
MDHIISNSIIVTTRKLDEELSDLWTQVQGSIHLLTLIIHQRTSGPRAARVVMTNPDSSYRFFDPFLNKSGRRTTFIISNTDFYFLDVTLDVSNIQARNCYMAHNHGTLFYNHKESSVSPMISVVTVNIIIPNVQTLFDNTANYINIS